VASPSLGATQKCLPTPIGMTTIPSYTATMPAFLLTEGIARNFGAVHPLPNLAPVLERRADAGHDGCPPPSIPVIDLSYGALRSLL
jgi:hypothetical protein